MASPIFTEISSSEETNWLLLEAKTGTGGARCEKSALTATSRSKLLKDASDTDCVACGTVLHLSLLHFTCQLERAESLHPRCLVSHFSILMNTLFILKQACIINKWYHPRENFPPPSAQGTAFSPIIPPHPLADPSALDCTKGRYTEDVRTKPERIKSWFSVYLLKTPLYSWWEIKPGNT